MSIFDSIISSVQKAIEEVRSGFPNTSSSYTKGSAEAPPNSILNDSFEVYINNRYTHPSMPSFVFMITAYDYSGMDTIYKDTVPYYSITFWVDKKKVAGAVEIRTKYTQKIYGGDEVDLCTPGIWASVKYRGEPLPFQLLRSQTSLLCHWLNPEEMTSENQKVEF